MATGRKNRLTISEIMDKLNIGGDIAFQQHAKGQKRKAESLMHLLTVKGKEATGGNFKGKGAIDTLSFLANFIPIPVVNKLISGGLKGLSMNKQNEYLTEKSEDFRKKALNVFGGDYQDYKQSGSNAILSQVEQANELEKQENTKKFWTDMVLSSGIPQAGVGKAGEAIKGSEWAAKLGAKVGLKPGNMVESFQKMLPSQLNPMMDVVPFGTTFPGTKSAPTGTPLRKYGPNIRDYFNILNPLLKKKPRGQATYPGLPSKSNIPSLRRSIR
mgnify:CR=1 FL=1|tara:strand:- start:469 stop:1281 length:813 start_codon:yes stop_codon:yes gene_type:complete